MHYSSIPGRKNFYISPLKESPFKPPSSPSNMTPRSRKLYSFGELLGSAEKLKSINESMAAFKSRGNLPYVTTVRRTSSKRLSFDEMPSSDIINGNDITDQDVVVKKKRVTPPAVVSLSASGQRNGETDKESNCHHWKNVMRLLTGRTSTECSNVGADRKHQRKRKNLVD
ncbi:hypothetical protein DPMN_140122 [Dreissena polymorpha]|uniref:Retinoblastoma-associated protein C-terminal domain-containing protein n=1 Tax=Dreissena polymorpha TaxID=45954 RepID=A0A9D4G7L1_DREPO|nr:hypothetical protein DPMN_140122 [Dreissena polymorpha]